MKKKLLSSLVLTILLISSFPFLPAQAANAVGYVKVTLLDVLIIDDHDSFPLGAGEIYFNFDINGSEFSTGQTDTDSGNNVTLNFVLFDSLIEDQSSLYFYVSCWDYDDLDSDDFIGEYNFTLPSLDLTTFVATYGNYEVFTFPDTDAIFYFEVMVEDTITLPPETGETAYVTITLLSAVIHDKHEAPGKGDGEIYFSYQIYDTRRSTTEYKDITDGETIVTNLEIYKGSILNDKLYFDIFCLEADIDADDALGGIVHNYPVFNAEWWRANRTSSYTVVIPISDVTFTVKIDVTYPAVPGNYEIIGLLNEATIYFDTTRDAQVTIHYGTSQGSLTSTLNMIGYRSSHSASIGGLSAMTKYYFKVVTTSLDGEVYVDDNGGSMFSFETIVDLPVYSKVTKNLGLEEFYYQDLTGGIGFVNFTIGMFAGLYVPVLFEQETPKYLIPGNSVSTEVTITPEEGYVGAEVIGEVEVYGYKLQLFDPISYYYNYMTPFGDLTLYSFSYTYPIGALNKTDDIFSIDIVAGIEVLFEVGIYLEANTTIWFAGDVDDGTSATYAIANGGETVIHGDTVSGDATDGATVDCVANTTLQFNNLYFRLKQVNLTIEGSVDTIIASNPSIDWNYEIVGDTGLFSPITFPVLNGQVFPVPLKFEDLKTVSTVEAVDPVVSGVTDSHVSGDIYKVQATVTDNRAVWDVVATVEYEDLSTQVYAMNHVSGDLYEFIFTIPDGESATVSIAARDIGGRVDGDVIVVDNPPEVPELGNLSIITSLILIPLAIVPIIMKRRKKMKV